MYVRKLVAGTAFGILTMACAAHSADAADWQALHGATATPMTSAQMQAVQGKASMWDYFGSLSGGYNSASFGSATVLFWASEPGTKIGVSGTITASAPYSFSQTLSYSPTR
jgi:hypothetical protein